ncbi:expressed unknown protein [Seminavis robusta]|uniref:SET domain-containing protein n=1 Tax=Seminavis robusta TaxID=568900 RepID=A0A9N8EMS7_9STRA|nr:expressed unknown protein [Seminavis robusta]|eukprot:Sro1190_g250850.1 n/a (398) ;mRNA; f:30186-31379
MRQVLLVFVAVQALLLLLLSHSAEGLAAKSSKKSKKLASAGGKGFGASSSGAALLHTPDDSESTQKLLQFLKSQKAKGVDQGVAEIGIHDKTGQRGLFATTNIKKDQIICMIPSDVALALSDPAKLGKDAPTFAHGGANFLNMYWNNAERRPLWSFYLDTLPSDAKSPYFDATPDFFSPEEIELLEFPRLLDNIRKRQHDIESLAAEQGLDQDQLQFATWLVSSRAFNINLADAQNTPEEEQYDERGQVVTKAGAGLNSIRVMVPFLDLCNHDSVAPNCRFTMIDADKDEAWFALEANRPIPAGRELQMAYRSGIYSSVELLLNYGFVPTENKVDAYMLRKGGEGVIASADGWTTTLEEDQSMLDMLQSKSDDDNKNDALKKILAFRSNMKKAYQDL